MDDLKNTMTDPAEALAQADANAGLQPPEAEEAPSQSASKDEWLAYREEQGHEGLDEMTKQELIDL